MILLSKLDSSNLFRKAQRNKAIFPELTVTEEFIGQATVNLINFKKHKNGLDKWINNSMEMVLK